LTSKKEVDKGLMYELGTARLTKSSWNKLN
jgi:hypothetical protein